MILYLDTYVDKTIRRTLARFGTVLHAADITEALYLIAENDFDYYFIDADAEESHAFLKHLQHDPQLKPPRAIVLLTENDDEDCDAWGVDTFLTRSRISSDLPYIFSHLRGKDYECAEVLAIAAPGPGKSTPGIARLKALGAAGEADAEADQSEEKAESNQGREVSEFVVGVRASRKAAAVAADPGRTKTRGRVFRFWRLAACALAIMAFASWLFIYGPLSDSGKKGREKTSESLDAKVIQTKQPPSSAGRSASSAKPVSSATALAESETPDNGDVTTFSADPAPTADSGADSQQSGEQTPAREQIPEPESQSESESGPMEDLSVHISGPSTVQRGQQFTLTANVSGAVGGVSYSWGGSSITSEISGGGRSYSVTVTDGAGRSASASIYVAAI